MSVFFRSDARYNDRGQVIEMAYFDAAGKPARHKDGNTNWSKDYDKSGKVLTGTNWGYDPAQGFFRVVKARSSCS